MRCAHSLTECVRLVVQVPEKCIECFIDFHKANMLHAITIFALLETRDCSRLYKTTPPEDGSADSDVHEALRRGGDHHQNDCKYAHRVRQADQR